MALQIPGGRSEHGSGSIIHFLPMDAANKICPTATTPIGSKKVTDPYATDELTPWLKLATRGSVTRRAVVIASLVGTLLALINHGDQMLVGAMSGLNWRQVFVTFLVPYMVSTYSSVVAIRTQQRLSMAKRDAASSGKKPGFPE